MDISYLGHSSFRLKGKKAVVVTDPFDPKEVGLKYPSQEADIVTISHDHFDHNYLDGVKNYKKILNSPGEYEVMETSFIGISSFHDDEKGEKRGKNTIFVIEMDGVRICHLGDLGQKLTDAQIEQIGDIDVLMIPIGGEYTIGSQKAVEVMQQIDPYFVLPMHYQTSRLNQEKFSKLEPVDNFLKESGLAVERLNKFSIKKEEIIPDSSAQIIVFEK